MNQYKLIVALLAMALPAWGAQVTKIGKNQSLVLISQESGQPWKQGDRVCVQTQDANQSCGTITSANRVAAMVKLTGSPEVHVAVGDQVVRANEGDRSPSSLSSETSLEPHTENYSQMQVSAELGGPGLLYSVYGSYRFAHMFCANIGLSYLSLSASSGVGANATSVSASAFQVPLSASLLLGGENSSFEVLGGADLVIASGAGSVSMLGGGVSGTTLVPEFGVGYRYWPHDGGFHFRALLMGLIVNTASVNPLTGAATTASGFVPWGGLSFGYAF